MNESIPEIALALAAGLLLGLVFFGGLHWTVRRVVTCRHPAALALGSFLLRAAIVVAGFVWVAGESWLRLLAALAGFVAARSVALRVWGKPRTGTTVE